MLMKVSAIKRVPKESLEQFLAFKRMGSTMRPKKGKGSYSRKAKHKRGDLE